MIDFYIQRHEAFLTQTMNNAPIPAEIIRSAINYALFPGGKRIRPVLVYLAGDLLAVDIKILDVIAAAIELIHCYSLIHDDLPAMDNDDFRRGKPSCHKAYDEATAILAGDGLQALAIEVLIKYLTPLIPASALIKVILVLVEACGINGMISGQSLDLSELSKPDLKEQQLQHIHQLKTGALISACFEMVFAAQNVEDHALHAALRTYAQHIGLVFQIQDDYLDRYAPNNILGKSHSSDLANDKTTFASLWSQTELEQKISMHYEQALACLQPFAFAATHLLALTQQLQSRSHLA